MRYQFQLGLFLLLVFSALTAIAEDRELGGTLVSGVYDTFGDLQSTGLTTVPSGTSVVYQTLGSNSFNPGFRVEFGGEMKIRTLEGPDSSSWKMNYFGTLEVDMSADPDNDGISNLSEFILGTDPTVADSDVLYTDSDNDGIADSWEMEKYGSLIYSDSDDPEGDSTTIADEYQDFLDYLYTHAFIYLSGTLNEQYYKAIEIHSRQNVETVIPDGILVQLTKGNNLKLFPGFKVEAGGELIVRSIQASALSMEAPSTPTNLTVFASGNNSIELEWNESKEMDVAGYNIYRNDILITPGPVINNQYIDTSIVHNTLYTYQVSAVDEAGKESERTFSISITADLVPPNLISVYPTDGETVSSDGIPVFVRSVYGDDGSGIASIRLYDENDIDITNHAIVSNNTIELLIVKPENNTYNYTFVVKDQGNNTLNHQLSFTLNNDPLVTTASIPGGRYTTEQTVTLTCSKPATIYFTTDGYPPIEGQASVGVSPVENIIISGNTSLQFFAKDQSGNQEKTKSEVYIFNNELLETSGLSATYQDETDTTSRQVILNWSPVTSQAISGYTLYKCNNDVECDILAKSRTGKYPPPERFALNPSPITPTTLTDTDLVVGSIYRYGLLAEDESGLPGLLSDLVTVEITTDELAEDLAEAIDRATAWIRAQQDITGFWGNKEELKLLATSKALDALKAKGIFDAGIYRGVFFLRGHFADNNDFLSRKVITLHAYNQNTDEAINRLISQSNIDGNNINGWGIHTNYSYDALDTSLGLLASLTPNAIIPDNQSSTLLSTGPDIFSSEGANHYGWVSGYDTSIYVSALAYHAMDRAGVTPLPDSSWILNLQETNGSFADNLSDTAAVLLWLTPGDTIKNNAVSYLLSQQELNGSWGNDVYLTGLCLEALLEGLSI